MTEFQSAVTNVITPNFEIKVDKFVFIYLNYLLQYNKITLHIDTFYSNNYLNIIIDKMYTLKYKK